MFNSRRSSSSRPRGQLAKKLSERLEDNEQDRRDEDEDREFVEPAEPDVAPGVALGGEGLHQAPAPQVIADEDRDQRELGVEPAAERALEPAEPEPDAEGDGEHRARRHDSPEKLALHHLEALDGNPVLAHRVVDEEPRQVEEARGPGHHENEVQRLYPEHWATIVRRMLSLR